MQINDTADCILLAAWAWGIYIAAHRWLVEELDNGGWLTVLSLCPFYAWYLVIEKIIDGVKL